MSHPIPKDLKEDKRLLDLPWFDLFLTKRGAIYALLVSVIAYLFYLITKSGILFLVLLLMLNVFVYPLGQMKESKDNFDGGNINKDVLLYRKYQYKISKKRIYIRLYKIYKGEY